MAYDCVIIGAGLVGLASGYQILRSAPGTKLLILEKEAGAAQHQSTRNSGVIHSGIYYKPGSFKAKLCFEGRSALIQFAQEHGVPHEICGKVIVALGERERPLLNNIYNRGVENGIEVERLTGEQLREREPHVAGIEGLWVGSTGIVSFRAYADALVREITRLGGVIRLNSKLDQAKRVDKGWWLSGSFGEEQASFVVNCGGLFCDRIVRTLGDVPPLQIVPFRGEYYTLSDSARSLCKGLIYPVPDPNFPFLGVHFTRRIDGAVECGPNAVLALAREGYSWGIVRPGDLLELLQYRGFHKLIARHWRMGLGEMKRSLIKAAFVKALQRLVPDVRANDLVPADAGVRAQAVRPDGALEDDFAFHRVDGALHVLNAPSPAATGSLAIGRVIAEEVAAALRGSS